MKKVFGLIIVIVLSFWSFKSLMGRGYFPMHDDTQVARVVVMGKALSHGQFPVRWVSDLGYGYGYPLYNFYGPLPYYFGGSLYALGVNSITSTKWMFGIGIILAAITMYLFLYTTMGMVAAVTGSMIFLYAPYHAVQVYIRGSVGEYWAIACVPLILLGIYKKNPIIGSLGLAGTILSHTILGFISTVILGISTVLFSINRRNWNILKLLLLGLGLSAFFWLPAFMEMQYTGVSAMISASATSISDHFICVSQLWNAPWGYGGSAPGCVDGMSFKIGKFHTIVLGLSLLLLFINRSKKRLLKMNKMMICIALCTACMIFLTLPYSSSLWKIFPMTRFIQYPWRLLSFTMLGIGIMSAYLVASWKAPIMRFLFAAIIVISAIMINAKLFVPQYQYLRDSYQFETNEELRFRVSKISDEYLPPGIIKPEAVTDIQTSVVYGKDGLIVKVLQERDTFLYIEFESSTAQAVTIGKAWFPGWSITLNGNRVTPHIENGFPSVNIEAGKSIIQMQFGDTPVRKIADSITLITVIIFMTFIILYGKKTKT